MVSDIVQYLSISHVVFVTDLGVGFAGDNDNFGLFKNLNEKRIVSKTTSQQPCQEQQQLTSDPLIPLRSRHLGIRPYT